MPRRFPGDRITDLITEVGEATTDSTGFIFVPYAIPHYASINIIVSPENDSFNAFIHSTSVSGFMLGTSIANGKVSYKIISKRA
jgi:hypothetical protein